MVPRWLLRAIGWKMGFRRRKIVIPLPNGEKFIWNTPPIREPMARELQFSALRFSVKAAEAGLDAAQIADRLNAIVVTSTIEWEQMER